MQFGLFMMPLHPPHRAFADGYDRDVAQIVLADQLGFREVWVGEHLTERWENAPAPDLLLAQALALTKTVRLGTGVTLLALHNPVYLAHRLAMLDHMARGRFQWGIGGGGIPTDLSLFGLDHTNPSTVRARSAEVLDVVLKLWASEGRFTYHGKFFDIDTPVLDPVKDRGYYMKPYQQPHPPIAVPPALPTRARCEWRESAAGFRCQARSCLDRISVITGAWSKPAPRGPDDRRTGVSGVSRATCSSRRRRRWPASERERSWDGTTCSISTRIASARRRWR